jgi:AcrR family transcriptional regulator
MRAVGRPRRSGEEEEAIRAEVVGIARELFTTEGYESISMRKIAERAGCAAATLYRYFSSKWELLRFVWKDVLEDAYSECDRAAEGLADPVERLRAYAVAYGQYWLDHPDHYCMIFTVQDRLLARGDRYFVQWPGAISRFSDLAATVYECMQAGRFADQQDPVLVAQALFCSVQGLVGTTITVPELPWGDRREILECGVDILLPGLSSGETSSGSRTKLGDTHGGHIHGFPATLRDGRSRGKPRGE